MPLTANGRLSDGEFVSFRRSESINISLPDVVGTMMLETNNKVTRRVQ